MLEFDLLVQLTEAQLCGWFQVSSTCLLSSHILTLLHQGGALHLNEDAASFYKQHKQQTAGGQQTEGKYLECLM